MPVRDPIDAALYVRMFPLDVPSTVALVMRLIGLVPASKEARDKDEIKRIRPAAKALRERGMHLQQTWRLRDEKGTTKLRPIDIEWDAAWSALLARIEPWHIFDGTSPHAADAKTAAELIALLFTNRLDFTRLELNAQWAEGDKRLTWIRTKDLREPLVHLAGEPFVARIEETHARLGRALGLSDDAPDADLPLVVDLAGAKRATHDAILAYALQLMAADATASDGLSAQIRASFAVIEEFRARARPSPAVTDGTGIGEGPTDAPPPVDPSTPMPPLPAE